MIRINLLPVKAAKKRESLRKQLLLGGMVMAGALAGIFAFHGWQSTTASAIQGNNASIQTAINLLKSQIGDYDVIKAQREDLIRQKTAIQRLERARSGPVYLLRELTSILTRGQGPTFNREQYEETLRRDPNAGLNSGWEPKRVWLLSYTEKDHTVTIHVGAKSGDDVAEFLKRLKLSAFFSEVYWQQTQPQYDAALNVSYVTFDVACRVNY